MRRIHQQSGITIWEVIAVIFIIVVVAAILFPVFARERIPSRKSSCQSNLKELTTALILYQGDYDGMLPSSALRGTTTWDIDSYERFATEFGSPTGIDVTWAVLLDPYLYDEDVVWCPSDPTRHKGQIASETTSYWYKAAIDRAWFDSNGAKGCKKEKDFEFPADQIVFFEHEGRHWGDGGKGLTNGVTINCGYMDGHVATKRINDSSQPKGKADPTAPGEPNWFNYDYSKNKPLGVGRYYDPRRYGDNLP